MKKLYYVLSALFITAMPIMKFPQAEISNGIIRALIYIPDSKEGYYRGTRFDWSGNIPELNYKDHSYFGQWFTKYSPEIHDAIMGPVEEFTPLDYLETKAGDSFLKIGVGMLSKPDERAYSFSRLYDVVNPGRWTVEKQSGEVRFIHVLKDEDYSYQYEKDIRLVKDKSEMTLSHKLKNTGKKPIETSVYCHNFFVIDNQKIGPGYTVSLPFDIKGEGNGIGELAEIEGKQIYFLRQLADGETVFCGGLEGFGPGPEDYDIRIENKTTGAGVRITCNQPILRFNFWCCYTTLCPEPYINIKVDPGQEFQWEIKYEFYTF
jgi:hypothetical protein